MTVAYAIPRNIYDLGFSAIAFVVRPRGLDPEQGDALDYATGTFRMVGHGFSDDANAPDMVQFVMVGGAGAAGVPPTGASLATPYYPIPVDYFRFRLATSPGGPAVTFGNSGSGAWALQIDPERRLMRIAFNVSADIDQDLTADAPPLTADPLTGKFHEKVVGIVARETARRAVAGLIFDNPAFRSAKERVDALQAQDDEQRAAWRQGQPLNPRAGDQTTVNDNSARARAGRRPAGWLRGDGSVL